MGFHDRADDENYSSKLRLRATPLPEVRALVRNNPALVDALANFSSPSAPVQKCRQVLVTPREDLPVGAEVQCVRNTRTDWAPVTLVLVTNACGFYAPLETRDANALILDFPDLKSISGRVTGKNAAGQTEILLDLKE
jgi:hypothetical protein